jgi:chromosome segregation ATPase
VLTLRLALKIKYNFGLMLTYHFIGGQPARMSDDALLKPTSMSHPEPTLSSTDQVILTRMTRMIGVPEEIRAKLVLFRQKFIDSTTQIQNQRALLAHYVRTYKERSSVSTVHKSDIQAYQIQLEEVLQEIEDLKFTAAAQLKLQDVIEEQQKIYDQMLHMYEETVSQKDKAKERRKNTKQEIQRTETMKAQLRDALLVQWDKHSQLTKTLRDHEIEGQALTKSNDETHKAISLMQANADDWRRKLGTQEQVLHDEIRELQRQINAVDATFVDVSNEKNEAISSYQQQIASLQAEIVDDEEKINEQVKAIGSLKARIDYTIESTQKLKDSMKIDQIELAEQKSLLCNLMGELAERMSLPEVQTKEIATQELVNRDLKRRRDELHELWRSTTSDIEELADKLARARIAKYDPAAQEAAIKERLLRDSAMRVHEITESASKLVTCGFCQQILEMPVTLVPCGHAVCHSHRFHQMEGPVCPVCGEHCVRAFVDSSLAVVVSKFIYTRDVLQMIGK